jgi:ATP-binding cassette subfamily A (ABC1) protein 3
MKHALADFTKEQLSAVDILDGPSDIPKKCPQNFNGLSNCYAVVVFTDMAQNGSTPHGVNYTIFADAGLTHIDVEGHTSDLVKRILPLQWAIDKVRVAEFRGFESLIQPIEILVHHRTADERIPANSSRMGLLESDECTTGHGDPT